MKLAKYLEAIKVSTEEAVDVVYSLELDNAYREINELNESIDQFITMETSLETLKEDLESVESIEGDTKTFAQMAFESHLAALGQETTVSVEEGIGDTLSNIWKAIVNAIKKAFRAVAEFFKRIFRFLTGKKKELESEEKRTLTFTPTPTASVTETLEDVAKRNLEAEDRTGKKLKDFVNDASTKTYVWLTLAQQQAFQGLSGDLGAVKDAKEVYLNDTAYVPVDTSKIKVKDQHIAITKIARSCFSYVDYVPPATKGTADSDFKETVNDILSGLARVFTIDRTSTLAKQNNVTKAVNIDPKMIIKTGDELVKRCNRFNEVSKLAEGLIDDLEVSPKKAFSKAMTILGIIGDNTGDSTIPCGRHILDETSAKGMKLNYTKKDVNTNFTFAITPPSSKQLRKMQHLAVDVANQQKTIERQMKQYDRNVKKLTTVTVADVELVQEELLALPPFIHKLMHVVYNEYLFNLGRAITDYVDGVTLISTAVNDLYDNQK